MNHMNNDIIKLDALDRQEALRYLGMGKTEPDDNTQRLLDECEKLLLEAARPQYVYRCFECIHREEGVEAAGTNLILTGNSIKEHLKGCDRMVLLCVTISAEVDRLLRKLELKAMAAMVVADSLSSVAVEQVCSKAEQIIADKFEGTYQTWRFGIGYGDLPLTLQPDFLRILDAGKRVGVYATKSCLLTPRKSVTCIIGVSDKPLPKSQRGCQTCNMKEKCPYSGTDIGCGR